MQPASSVSGRQMRLATAYWAGARRVDKRRPVSPGGCVGGGGGGGGGSGTKPRHSAARSDVTTRNSASSLTHFPYLAPTADEILSRNTLLEIEIRTPRYGTKCGGCAQGISPQDLVRKARDKVFHLNCFTCMVCRKQLSTGEELYVLDDNKFICKDDYMSGKTHQGGGVAPTWQRERSGGDESEGGDHTARSAQRRGRSRVSRMAGRAAPPTVSTRPLPARYCLPRYPLLASAAPGSHL
ncbi:uncharacterized protein LOC126101516 [Schistocerca cancellata]|uniref:uncharacterized protein LOC126101516 n=1 Tax=Schistocerca cancellata TaxID=274614 RepID=UPI0021183F8D|nr:uncharacterized protein LOC126101516 [Schistocerca cancellata]